MLNPTYIIKRLNNSHREKVLGHFLRLDKDSLYSRFCAPLSQYAVETYVSKINFNKDGVFGIFDDDLNIIGVGECVIEENTNRSEVGFSVEINHQGQGLGGKLLERIVRFAKAHEKTHLEMLCLRTNKQSQHLARKFGLKVQLSPDSEALGIIDMEGTKPTIEQMNENIEDTMAYYALQQKQHVKNMREAQKIYNQMCESMFFGTMKMMTPRF